MLYILIILVVILLFVGRLILLGYYPTKDFNLAETLPLRGFLAICVMLPHLCPYLVDEAPLLDDFGLWGPPSVGTFFLLAGYGLAFSYKKKGRDYLRGFFKKRFLKLLWPLLIMTLVYQGYKAYNGCFSLKEVFICPSPMSWFIYALVIWYVGFYVAFKVGGARNIQITLVWLFTLIYLVATIYLRLAYYYISILPMPMALTYVFYEKKVKEFISRHNKVIYAVVMLMSLVVMGYAVAGQYGMRLPGWGLPVYTFVPCVIVYVTYYLGGWKNKVSNFLGRISYEFYIVHGFIVMQMGHVHIFGLTGYDNVLIVIFVVCGLTITFAWLLSQLCDIFNNKLFVEFKIKNKL